MRHVDQVFDSVNPTSDRGPVTFVAVGVCKDAQAVRVRHSDDLSHPLLGKVRPRVMEPHVSVGSSDFYEIDTASDVITELWFDHLEAAYLYRGVRSGGWVEVRCQAAGDVAIRT